MVEQAGADELGDRVHESGAAKADRRNVPDHRQLDLAVANLHALDRAFGGTHAAADLCGLERRARRRRGGKRLGGRAEHDLGVGADVDEQPDAPVERQTGGKHTGDDVGANVRAERREQHRGCALVHLHAEVGCLRLGQAPGGDRERRHRERLGVDAERELDHRDVAGDDDLVDVCGIDSSFRADLRRQLLERLVRAILQHPQRALVEHRRRDPRDDVGTEWLLRVQDRLDRLRLPRLEIEQRCDHRRRAEIERERVAAAGRVARLDVDQEVVDEHGGNLPVRPAQRPA